MSYIELYSGAGVKSAICQQVNFQKIIEIEQKQLKERCVDNKTKI